MKIFLTLFAVLAITLLLWQCNRSTYTVENFPDKGYLTFGNGGGYAGALTTHYLLDNGQLFTSNGIAGEKQLSTKTSARKTKKLFQQYQDSLINVQYDVPGNIYYFLEWVGDDTSHKIQWGTGQKDAPATAAAFYRQLTELLPKETE